MRITPTIIDRYIARRFFDGIIITFFVCAVLIFMIDLIELLRQSGKFRAVPLPTLVRIALLRLPIYTEFLIGFAVLVGSIGALLYLGRKSELTVMRASGMSAWRFLRPGIAVAILLGVLSVTLYNPLAAHTRTEAENLHAEAFGREANLFNSSATGAWLRQNGADGPSVINAGAVADHGFTLKAVTVLVFDSAGIFRERVDGREARLKDGYWEVADAFVARVGEATQSYSTYLVSTYLTRDRVSEALGSAYASSFWELPALIQHTEKAALSSTHFRMQYGLLLARPLLCAVMVLLAATVSLKSFRGGGIQTMVVAGMFGGFGFFLLAEVSRQLGLAGLAPTWAAVWLPLLLTMLVSLTVLMHQEDG